MSGVGLCATCEHVRVVRSDRGSVFYRCALAERRPDLPKYPRLPMIRCDGWTPSVAREEPVGPQ